MGAHPTHATMAMASLLAGDQKGFVDHYAAAVGELFEALFPGLAAYGKRIRERDAAIAALAAAAKRAVEDESRRERLAAFDASDPVGSLAEMTARHRAEARVLADRYGFEPDWLRRERFNHRIATMLDIPIELILGHPGDPTVHELQVAARALGLVVSFEVEPTMVKVNVDRSGLGWAATVTVTTDLGTLTIPTRRHRTYRRAYRAGLALADGIDVTNWPGRT